MVKFTITLLSISILSFLSSCTQNAGELSFMVNFPKSSPVLTEPEKIDLKKKIERKYQIQNTDESNENGTLEVTIK